VKIKSIYLKPPPSELPETFKLFPEAFRLFQLGINQVLDVLMFFVDSWLGILKGNIGSIEDVYVSTN